MIVVTNEPDCKLAKNSQAIIMKRANTVCTSNEL